MENISKRKRKQVSDMVNKHKQYTLGSGTSTGYKIQRHLRNSDFDTLNTPATNVGLTWNLKKVSK